MKTMHKFLAVVISAALAAGLLAGCGAASSTASSAASSEAVSSVAASSEAAASSVAGAASSEATAALPVYDADVLTGQAHRTNGRIVGVMVNNISNSERLARARLSRWK